MFELTVLVIHVINNYSDIKLRVIIFHLNNIHCMFKHSKLKELMKFKGTSSLKWTLLPNYLINYKIIINTYKYDQYNFSCGFSFKH